MHNLRDFYFKSFFIEITPPRNKLLIKGQPYVTTETLDKEIKNLEKHNKRCKDTYKAKQDVLKTLEIGLSLNILHMQLKQKDNQIKLARDTLQGIVATIHPGDILGPATEMIYNEIVHVANILGPNDESDSDSDPGSV